MVYAFFATRIRPQKHYLPKAFFSPKNTLQSSKAPYCRWQYGLLSPYFAALNTGFHRPISLRSIRALATLLPLSGGQYAPPLRLCARAMPLRAYAYATRPYCRWQYGLLSPYFAALNTGSCYAIAPTRGQCAPPLRLCARRSAACAHTPTQPARIAVGNTGQSNIIHPIHIKMILNSKHNSILSLLKTTHNDLHF